MNIPLGVSPSKENREPHEAKKKSFDLGGNRTHDLRISVTPSGIFMGLSSTIIYTSELILCSTICAPSATRCTLTFSSRLKSSPNLVASAEYGRSIRRSWVRFPPRSKDFFFASCGSLFSLLGPQWDINGFK